LGNQFTIVAEPFHHGQITSLGTVALYRCLDHRETAWAPSQKQFRSRAGTSANNKEAVMELGRKGVFWFTDTLDQAQLIELVHRSEQLGYSALWYPEALALRMFLVGELLACA
jgi:hypothetical protein